jgi:hypothetical protein
MTEERPRKIGHSTSGSLCGAAVLNQGDADGDGGGASCNEMSGVPLGEGVAGKGDVPAGEFSFSEDGACINESKESLAGVGDGVAAGDAVGEGEAGFSCPGVGAGFSGVAAGSACAEGAFLRCAATPARSFFFGFASAGASSSLPCTIVPETCLETT